MLATSKNLDFTIVEIRNYFNHFDNSLKKEYDNLVSKIEYIILNEKNIRLNFDKILPQVFNFRIKALKWLIENEKVNLLDTLNEVQKEFEIIKENKKLRLLAENILFALRVNQRVVNSLLSRIHYSNENFRLETKKIDVINYEQFISSISIGIPDDEISQKILDFVHNSLYIEIVSLSAILINDKNLKISSKKINELSEIISNAAQNYFALAMDLHIISSYTKKIEIENINFDKKFVKEQKELSDLGLEDLFKI
jgi:hypothetical protein